MLVRLVLRLPLVCAWVMRQFKPRSSANLPTCRRIRDDMMMLSLLPGRIMIRNHRPSALPTDPLGGYLVGAIFLHLCMYLSYLSQWIFLDGEKWFKSNGLMAFQVSLWPETIQLRCGRTDKGPHISPLGYFHA
jgi:hypothetical protein